MYPLPKSLETYTSIDTASGVVGSQLGSMVVTRRARGRVAPAAAIGVRELAAVVVGIGPIQRRVVRVHDEPVAVGVAEFLLHLLDQSGEPAPRMQLLRRRQHHRCDP